MRVLTLGSGNGDIVYAQHVVITTGTFLGGEIHIGMSCTGQDLTRRVEIVSVWKSRRACLFQVERFSTKCGI
jgi:tRNA U34 5-carboxymethylaminomethyl modifying enzyme MnmG/GidA